MNAHLSVALVLLISILIPLRAAAQRLVFPGAERGSVSGTVLLLHDSSPVGGVTVRLRLATGGVPATVLTDSRGEFEFTGLTSGLYFLDVEERGYEAIRESVQVGFGYDRALTLHLTRFAQAPSGQNPYLVSVRELSIPSKAAREFQKGLECSAKNDSAGSLLHFHRAVQEYPKFYEAYLQMGFAYRHLGQAAEAEQAMRTSIAVSGERFADAHFSLGEILAAREQYGDAEKAVRRGLKLQPTSWAGQYILARSLYGLNRLEEAEDSAKRALKLKSDFARVHLLLANIHIRTRDDAALLEDLDAYLALDPNGEMSVKASRMRVAVLRRLDAPKPAPAAAPTP
jgi:tetratricopeptide (TPR) repeat protein